MGHLRFISALFLVLFFTVANSTAANFETERDSLLKQLRNIEDSREGNILCRLGSIHYRNFDFDEGLQYASKGLRIGKKVNDEKLIIRALRLFADIYYAMAKYDLSLHYFFTELEYHVKNSDIKKIAEVQCNIGVVYDVQGFLEKGLYHYLEAMRGYEKIEDWNGLMSTYSNLAHIYRGQGNHKAALRYFAKAAEIEEKYLKDKKPHYFLVNMAEANLSLTLYDTALFMADKAAEQILALPSPDDEDLLLMLDSYRIRGVINQRKGNTSIAISHLLKALQLAKQSGYKEKEAPVLILIADLALEQNDLRKAEAYLFEALRIGFETESFTVQRNAYRLLTQLKKQQGDYKQAVEYMEKYLQVHDTLLNLEGVKRMSEMREVYNAEKREGTIKLLEKNNEIQKLNVSRRENQLLLTVLIAILTLMATGLTFNRYRLKKRSAAELGQKNQELAVLNATKDKFFAILAHDLKSPIVSFKNISNQLKSNVEKLSLDDLKGYLGELEKGSNSIYKLFVNLLDWAKSQRNQIFVEPEEIELGCIVESVIDLFDYEIQQKELDFDIRMQDRFSFTGDRNIVYTVLRNLIGNSIKYSNKGGRVFVFAHQNHEGGVEIMVKDEGCGISPDDIKKLFSIDKNIRSVGPFDKKGSGLGLILSKEYVARVGGSISVESTVGEGSCFTVTLPILIVD